MKKSKFRLPPDLQALLQQEIDRVNAIMRTRKAKEDVLQFKKAYVWLRKTYPQIHADPRLTMLFDKAERKARDGGDKRPYKVLYDELAKKICKC